MDTLEGRRSSESHRQDQESALGRRPFWYRAASNSAMKTILLVDDNTLVLAGRRTRVRRCTHGSRQPLRRM